MGRRKTCRLIEILSLSRVLIDKYNFTKFYMYILTYTYIYIYIYIYIYMCLCVWEREREKERERNWDRGIFLKVLHLSFFLLSFSLTVVIAQKIDSTSRFQTLDLAVCFSFSVHAFQEAKNLSFFLPSVKSKNTVTKEEQENIAKLISATEIVSKE